MDNSRIQQAPPPLRFFYNSSSSNSSFVIPLEVSYPTIHFLISPPGEHPQHSAVHGTSLHAALAQSTADMHLVILLLLLSPLGLSASRLPLAIAPIHRQQHRNRTSTCPPPCPSTAPLSNPATMSVSYEEMEAKRQEVSRGGGLHHSHWGLDSGWILSTWLLHQPAFAPSLSL